MQADLMKLIAYGKVMEDDTKTLKEYTIKEGDFIVVMISKVSNQKVPQIYSSVFIKMYDIHNIGYICVG